MSNPLLKIRKKKANKDSKKKINKSKQKKNK